MIFNDIFVFLVFGLGIIGDFNFMNNVVNIVILFDGILVQINSVNNFFNWEYYCNNFGG